MLVFLFNIFYYNCFNILKKSIEWIIYKKSSFSLSLSPSPKFLRKRKQKTPCALAPLPLVATPVTHPIRSSSPRFIPAWLRRGWRSSCFPFLAARRTLLATRRTTSRQNNKQQRGEKRTIFGILSRCWRWKKNIFCWKRESGFCSMCVLLLCERS